jgi:hypothetical protein
MKRIVFLAATIAIALEGTQELSMAGESGRQGNSAKCAELEMRARGINSTEFKGMGKLFRKRGKMEKKMRKAGCLNQSED